MSRSVLVDLFKVLASQLIVLHHLCLYSPMADRVAQAWPALVDFIVEDGRLAVQPFLVIGGFLAAQTLHKRRDYPVFEMVVQRYLRLAPQLGIALLLVMAATVAGGHEFAGEEWVSPLPSASVLLAHLLFLQDVLGTPSLLAGAWYIAIDLQLFALFVVLLYAAHKLPRLVMDLLVPALLAAATWASIWIFSREPGLDMWAIYFLSAYGLGALAAWSAYSQTAKWLWWSTVAVLVLDCLVEPRERPLWALGTALALYAGGHWSWGARLGLLGRAVQSLSAWSYGVFVCHFAVIIVVSGLWLRFDLTDLSTALVAFVLVVLASLGLGGLAQAASDRLVSAGKSGWRRWRKWRRWLALTSPR
jgi:peptidoglycan/LPS O-acetylase OafA/YrhL